MIEDLINLGYGWNGVMPNHLIRCPPIAARSIFNPFSEDYEYLEDGTRILESNPCALGKILFRTLADLRNS